MVCFYYRKRKKDFNISYSEAMAKHYRDKENKDEACMAAPDTERSDREELARRREILHRKEEEVLAKISYTWDSNIKAWWSDDLASLPLLKDSEARALADEIMDFVIK
mgnify:CR=1 FL=1